MTSDLITKISLKNFRIHHNYIEFATNDKFVIFSGRNASGKTSVLESISFLSQSSNLLLNAGNSNLASIGHEEEQSYICLSYSNHDNIKIEVADNRKYFYLNDKKHKHSDIAKNNRILSFIPSLQYAFCTTAGKRKLFDNFVCENYINHHNLLVETNKLIANRLKLILIETQNVRLIHVLERQIAANSILIAENRKKSFDMLASVTLSYKFSFILNGDYENILQESPSVESITKILEANRGLDKQTKRTNFSPHRFLFDIKLDQIDYNLLSSSQQKISLIEIYKLFAIVLASLHNKRPTLLIDEIDASLDIKNLNDIVADLICYFNQIFCTTPNNNINNGLLIHFE